MPTAPTVFCASTLQEARRAAWQWVSLSGAASFLDPPLVLAGARGFAAWRVLASEGAAGALVLPRLVEPETYFARFHSANVRQPALRGAARLWALASVLRALEPRLGHLDFDADDTDSLRAMAALLGRMRRQNEAKLPVGDDPFGKELDEWRAAYDAHLADVGAFDTEAAPTLFARNPEANRAFAFPAALVVDDAPDVSPALALGLGALIERAESVCATLALPNGFEDDVATRARAFWEKHGARFQWVETSPSPRLRAARALLGDAGAPDSLPDGVTLTHAHTPHDEWERIAAHIRARLDDGAHPQQFCVVVPDYAAQMPLARAAFRAHGVPLPVHAPDPAASPLVQKLLRVLAARGEWSVDELHDLFGDGTLQLRWTDEDGMGKRFDAGRLRRAHRSNRGESDEAAWRDPDTLARVWEVELGRIRDAGGKADGERAKRLTQSLDGGDLEGVARLKALLTPFAHPSNAGRWGEAALAVFDALCPPIEPKEDAEETAPLIQAALAGLRAGIAGVVARAGEEDVRAAGRWVAWLRVELASVRIEDEAAIPTACVRVLRVGEVGEAGGEGETDVFVPGLTERAWPARPPKSRWPATSAKALEALLANEAAPLALALHGLARLLAGGARLHLSFPAWQNGAEVAPSPLIEDLRALFPGAVWPELPLPERPTSRALWLRQLAASEATPTDPTLRALDAMRRERTDAGRFGRYDGVLGERGGALLAPLLPRDDGQLELSASGAESYARCGLRFFFERVLELGDEERAEDDLTRAEAGDLVHKVLHHFRREWSEPLDGSTFERARAALESHVWRECARLGLPPILRRAEARRLMGTAIRDGALTRILRAECRENAALAAGESTVFSGPFFPLAHLQQGLGATPTAHGFALSIVGNGLEQPFRLPLAGVTLRGRIDRLDASPDGAALRVLDYKTGSAAALPAFYKGSDRLHFQLAIYIEAARHLTGAWHPAPDVGAAYLSPRKGFAGVVASPALVGDKATRTALGAAAQAQWLADTRAQLERIAALIEAGTFNLSIRAPKVARCDYCAHAGICGQNPAIQTARAALHLDSEVVFYPAPVEW